MRRKVSAAAFLHRKRLVVRAEAHVHQLGFGNEINEISAAGDVFGVDVHLHGETRVSDLHDVGVKRHDVSHFDGVFKRKGRDGARHDFLREGVAHGGFAARQIHLTHDPTAEDVAVLIGVAGHRLETQRRDAAGGELSVELFFHDKDRFT